MINELHYEGNDWMVHQDELTPELLAALLDCGTPGQSADEAVAYVRANFKITGDRKACAAMLKGCGAWDNAELRDHDENLNRLVWLTGCALREEDKEAYFSIY